MRFPVLIDAELPKMGRNRCVLREDDSEEGSAGQELTAITLKRESFAALAFLGRQQPIVAPLEVTLRDLAQRQMPDMYFGLGQAQAILHRSHYAARITPITPPAGLPLDCHVNP